MKQWIVANGATLFLSSMVLVQWIALQALLIHYHFFRKNLKQPRPDGIRLQLLEQTVAVQNEQLDRIYGKLAEMRKELNLFGEPTTSKKGVEVASLEKNFISMGEIAMKKRLQEIRASKMN